MMTAEEYNYVRVLLERKAGILLEAGKEYLIESRVSALARRLGVDSISALMQHLRAEPNGLLSMQVVESLTTQETFFFRDVHPFEALRQTVLPDLIARRQAARRLTIWCAAASTGQEPYSVAMLLREHFPQLTNWQVQIVATDLSESALARAREGRFNQLEATRGLEPRLRTRYFTEHANGWQVRDEIRRMVEFKQINLMQPWPELGEMDIVIMRNVLIYFGLETKKSVLRRARQHLKADGYLLLGSAETTLHLEDSYDVVHLERTTLYRPKQPLLKTK